MTSDQGKLIKKTLGAIGYLSLLVAIGLVMVGIGVAVFNDEDIKEIFKDILDIDGAGIVFYPAIACSIIAFWLRAYLQAGSNLEEGGD